MVNLSLLEQQAKEAVIARSDIPQLSVEVKARTQGFMQAAKRDGYLSGIQESEQSILHDKPDTTSLRKRV